MRTARRVLVGLIVVATAAFVVGVVLERHQSHNEAAETPAQRAAEGAARTTTRHTESGESGNESAEHSRPGESGESGGENAEHGESGESGAGGGENAAHNESTKTTATPATTTAGSPPTETTKHSEASEKLLGVNPESTGLLVVAVVASLLLAAGARCVPALRRGRARRPRRRSRARERPPGCIRPCPLLDRFVIRPPAGGSLA